MYIVCMRHAPKILLTADERTTLEQWSRSHTTQKRYAFRADLVLLASAGLESQAIAKRLQTRSATVSKWRGRFSQHRIAGLQDRARSGSTPKYGKEAEQRVLNLLDTAPPKGYSQWDGPLMAKELGDVSVHQIWRILRKHKISLTRRHS